MECVIKIVMDEQQLLGIVKDKHFLRKTNSLKVAHLSVNSTTMTVFCETMSCNTCFKDHVLEVEL